MNKRKNEAQLIQIHNCWETKRFSVVFELSKGLSITKEDLKDEGVQVVNYGEIHSKYGRELNPAIHELKCVDNSYLENGKKSLLQYGDFVFADTSEDIEGSGNFTFLNGKTPIFAGYHTIIARPKIEVDYLFLSFLLDSYKYRSQIQANVVGVKVFSVTKGVLKRTNVWLPPHHTQTAIANFLDDKCGKIESLIANEENAIAELKEYKKATIRQYVKNGVYNHNIVNSGSVWIDKIPQDWKLLRGKYVLKLLNRPVVETDGVITCFRDGEVTLRSNRREDGFTMADKEIGYQGIEPNDLVIHGMDGFAGAIGISDARGKGSPILNVCDTNENKKYLMYYMRCLAYDEVFTALATGVRMRSCDLRWNKIANMDFAIPTQEEQNLIVEKIETTLRKTDSLIAIKQQKIAELKEYKKSLIYEYVTGKREVV